MLLLIEWESVEVWSNRYGYTVWCPYANAGLLAGSTSVTFRVPGRSKSNAKRNVKTAYEGGRVVINADTAQGEVV